MARPLPCAPALLALAALSLPPPATAQGVEFERPPHWRVRPDEPAVASAEDVYFVEMPPGWHVTTGPAAILWNPEASASGSFRVEMEVFLFDPAARREGFGLFLGGRDLDGPGRRCLYFLVREGGEFLLKERRGSTIETLQEWTPHPSVSSWADRPDDATTARNVLAVEADDDDVRFFVNDKEVLALPRSGLAPLDGVVGLRVNHALNLHVSRLEIDPGR